MKFLVRTHHIRTFLRVNMKVVSVIKIFEKIHKITFFREFNIFFAIVMNFTICNQLYSAQKLIIQNFLFISYKNELLEEKNWIFLLTFYKKKSIMHRVFELTLSKIYHFRDVLEALIKLYFTPKYGNFINLV